MFEKYQFVLMLDAQSDKISNIKNFLNIEYRGNNGLTHGVIIYDCLSASEMTLRTIWVKLTTIYMQ